MSHELLRRFNTVRSRVVQALHVRTAAQQPMPENEHPNNELFIPRDLLNVAQLEELARELASTQQVTGHSGDVRGMQHRLNVYEQRLQRAYRILAADVAQRQSVQPAAEWLLDNFPIVLDQIREVREDLPGRYYRELPKIADGRMSGLPRVYALATELLERTDSRVDAETLVRYILAYQSVTALSMGELWAVPIMLRFALIAHLNQRMEGVLLTRRQRQDGTRWGERIRASFTSPAQLSATIAELRIAHSRPAGAFALQLLYQIGDGEHESNIRSTLDWLNQTIVEAWGSIEGLTHAEHRRQAAAQATVGSIITSMRSLSSIDWPDWFERVSMVEHILRRDPAEIYARSTFATRDRYRHILERLARHSQLSEVDVAWQAITLASSVDPNGASRLRHVGYYLVGKGRTDLERAIKAAIHPFDRMRSLAARQPTLLYLGAIAAGTGLVVGGGLRALPAGTSGRTKVLAATALLLPASDIAQSVVNWVTTKMLPPRVMPRLDLREGITEELRTIVVVPMLLLTDASVQGQLENLEVLRLANDDPHLHFALLSDFADAPAATMPEDAERLRAATVRVQALNERYGADRFLFFHRRRCWNPQQGVWMGWERKRGKLEEFNRLLAGDTTTTYDVQVGNLDVLGNIRYVITLDADTQLPREAAQKLIGTMAHPLNEVVVDPNTNTVVDGYGVLQPRIGVDLTSAARSRFARIFAGNVGVDPYTTAVSDVYMDLFAEGIYAGKGIYDPQVFRDVLDQRFPENALLSHDLLEGSFVRAGLLSDVELLDIYPSTYAAYAARMHRWVRGDWQIIRWLLPRIPDGKGGFVPNPLPVIARYKIFDNLRRSLVPPATLGLLVAGWLVYPVAPKRWTVVALGSLGLPTLFNFLDLALALPRSTTPRTLLRNTREDMTRSLERLWLNFAFLPDQAAVNVDAIVRTLVRMVITQRNMLQWETAEQAQLRLSSSHWSLLRRVAPVLGIVVSFVRPRNVHVETIVALVPGFANWLFSPLVAAWLDRPTRAQTVELTADDRTFLRRLAREHWHYFETFVTDNGNYLAPDNYQIDPTPQVAHRTSPTNIGLQLLADLAAHDFGYLGLLRLTERTEHVLGTLDRLARFHGHFLNWYDTQTLNPLPPAYVSFVDSGNLAGHLLALHQGFADLSGAPIVGPALLQGLNDTLDLIERADSAGGDAALSDLRRLLGAEPHGIAGYRHMLAAIAAHPALVNVTIAEAGWTAALRRQVHGAIKDLDTLLQWLNLTDSKASPDLAALIDGFPSLDDLQRTLPDLLASTDDEILRSSLAASLAAIDDLTERHAAIIQRAKELLLAMDFRLLYDERRALFSIGYSVTENRIDASYYDLLASESRLGSFVAIAKGDVPQEHWFHLGRSLIEASGKLSLVSWSGTMFEYLMPLLVMRTYSGTLLDATYGAVVDAQIAYGNQQNVPWGVSESAYNARDLALNYQYRAFGIPELSLRRTLHDDLVVAPYATVLALLVRPDRALANLHRLVEDGIEADYGFFEAIDYTPDRRRPGSDESVVRSFMVHHQGMSLLALDNYLHNNVMQRRFHSEPSVKATELLLQERFPRVAAAREVPESAPESRDEPVEASGDRVIRTAQTALPVTHLLSNGTYTVMVTNSGSGYSRSGDIAVTRWREDPTSDAWGSFIYVRDLQHGNVWSPTFQPLQHASRDYEVIFSTEKAEYKQRSGGIASRMEITVSPEDQVEIRQLSLTNLTNQPSELEITSYVELVLAPPASDDAHPAFSKLFVQTEYVPDLEALVAWRRPRAPGQPVTWAVHVPAVRGHMLGQTEYETDRATFLGRNNSSRNPDALDRPLSGATGAVLDPIFSLRRRIRIVPGSTARITFATAIATTREEAIRLAQKYRDYGAIERAHEMAWTRGKVELRDLNISAAAARDIQHLSAALIYNDARMRSSQSTLVRNSKGQSGLWAYGISGDLPILLVRVADAGALNLVGDVLQAYEYWRLQNLKIDLVILNEDAGGYVQGLQDQILQRIRASHGSAWIDKPAGIHVLRADVMPEEDRVLIRTVARASLSGRGGTLGEQLARRQTADAQRTAVHPPRRLQGTSVALPGIELQQTSPYGGYTSDGSEYVIDVLPGQRTPMPWVNVVANERFGCVITERGAGYTWSENSRENKLTPWSNDPVADPGGEVLYLHELATDHLWSPTPYLDVEREGQYRVRHGWGYSAFEHQRNDIASTLTIFVPPDASAKVYQLHLHNLSDQPRRMTATLYVEWVLGVIRHAMAPYHVTSWDTTVGAIMVRNRYNSEFEQRVAFAAASADVDWTTDRTAFIGRNHDTTDPVGVGQDKLGQRAGAGFDSCAVLRQVVALAAGEERTLVFVLGQGADDEEARDMIQRYRTTQGARDALSAAQTRWTDLLRVVEVRTPNPEVDRLLNGWLLYQTLACRIWGRSAFYQSGGAFGYRDQLQDVMALIYAAPHLTREQLLVAARHQFVEGDVLHWWHEPTGRGIRTRFSDDYLWLPFVTSFYIAATGDTAVLDESVPFITGRPLKPDEAEYYDQPTIADEHGTLYEHCVRSIQHGLRFGSHGLPLMGAGDWNDGMNLVGDDGTGESVWVGWFLYLNLKQMAHIADERGDRAHAQQYRAVMQRLNTALEEHAWDGDWYLRAFFDDGTPLGSHVNAECRIDSLSQSWAVISGAASPQRARQGMAAVDDMLVDRDHALIRLFTPAFDDGPLEPGYIKGYVPGVRENGGQYTHAAIWVIWAYAMLGDGDKASELFRLINPIVHDTNAVETYKVEPYVIAADVYTARQHEGRGGWTWYTGSAGWMYRLGVEMLLGLRRTGEYLTLAPCIPSDWDGFEMTYRHGTTTYQIVVRRDAAADPTSVHITDCGQPMTDGRIPLVDDGSTHEVNITIGPPLERTAITDDVRASLR